MIVKYGMSDDLGPIYIDTEKDPYELQLFGEKFGDAVGAEVKIMIPKHLSSTEKELFSKLSKTSNFKPREIYS